jgi:hypothetical protein
MKRFWIALSVLLGAAVLWSQQIDLPLLGRMPLNIYSAMTFVQDGSSVLTDGISGTRNRLVRIDMERGLCTEYFEIHRFLGAVGDRILVSTVDREHILKLRFVDPQTLATTGAPGWTLPIDWGLVQGAGGSLYSARLDGRGTYTPYRFKPPEQVQVWLHIEGVPTSMTGDTLHLLIHNPDSGEIFIWSTEKRAVRARLHSSDPTGQVRFVTNSVVLLPPQYAGQESWRLYNLEGDEVAEVIFRIPGADPLFFWFTPDLRRAIACVRGRVNPETAVVNTEDFRRWLVEEGYLFVPTPGVLNDSKVRVRAYPTLEAEILGLLDRGDRVEVLERSGLQESIGEMNDFWYRIRTADGLSGWSYGHFIDLQ